MKHWTLLLLCVACGNKTDDAANAADTGTQGGTDHTQDNTGTESDCQQTTGELQVIGTWRDDSESVEDLEGARVIIDDLEGAPFEAILDAEAQLTIDLSAGSYSVSGTSGPTTGCIGSAPLEVSVASCALSTVTLAFEWFDGC